MAIERNASAIHAIADKLAPTRLMRQAWTLRGGVLSHPDPKVVEFSTAVHEAGHAVIAEYMGEKVQHVRIDGPQHGECLVAYRKRRGHADPMTITVVGMAGHEAEVRFTKRPINILPSGDVANLERIGCSSTSINLAGWVARHAVRRHARDIRRVARALLVRRFLTRRQFLRVLRSA